MVDAITTSPHEIARIIDGLDPAMIVVTVRSDDARSGCLVGFHSQCSIDPLRYAVWISKANHSFRVALAADVFVLHLLDAEEHPVAAFFGAVTGDEVDKFAHCAWHEGTDGALLLDDCATRVVARPVSFSDGGGDHVCFVVEPFEAHTAHAALEPLHFTEIRDLDAGHPPSDPPNLGPDA
jgi:flavin reductase (DIM6/NTAB) family NADH-FMN oxidoreductase RutF